MAQPRSSRDLIKKWHRREKATIDGLVRQLKRAKATKGVRHSAFTASGLAIEEQVRKAWRPSPLGLAMF